MTKEEIARRIADLRPTTARHEAGACRGSSPLWDPDGERID